MTPHQEAPPTAWMDLWLPELRVLADQIRRGVRERLAEVASGARQRHEIASAVGQGAGDVTFGLDVVAEAITEDWLAEVAQRVGPLSLLTEDAGWRHAPSGAQGFDHSGPRIALDPIDGTRNVMHDLRSAWVVVSCAGAGPGEPTMEEVVLGLVSEIPDSRGRVARELAAAKGRGATSRDVPCDAGTPADQGPEAPLRADETDRVDGGYFPFFGYHPKARAAAQALCANVTGRLEREDASLDASLMFDDQYISSGGQLALLALGTYRGIVDARVTLGRILSEPTQTAKPYDMAGAALVAQEAGCIVVAPDGAPLSFPLDATTPVEFAGFHSPAVAARVQPHLAAALAETSARRSGNA